MADLPTCRLAYLLDVQTGRATPVDDVKSHTFFTPILCNSLKALSILRFSDFKPYLKPVIYVVLLSWHYVVIRRLFYVVLRILQSEWKKNVSFRDRLPLFVSETLMNITTTSKVLWHHGKTIKINAVGQTQCSEVSIRTPLSYGNQYITQMADVKTMHSIGTKKRDSSLTWLSNLELVVVRFYLYKRGASSK